ncbi:MAG: hypothetical protein HY791_40170 [Deltaproteobacteria bacterium]|nr:hypothetical protein [Deltaproteobacteria bacterium]
MRRLALTPLRGAVLTLSLGACQPPETLAPVPFSDDFTRAELGPNWFPSGGHWTLRDGYAYSTGANNAPCFLRAALPKDVVVEVDVHSETAEVDSKIELMTNGRAHASGYVFIYGGWSNKISSIARLDEHGADRKEKKPTNAVGNRTYRWRIEKKGGSIKWLVDGRPYLSFEDPQPLDGPGHDRLALSNWQNRVRWDNLKIWPYADAPPVRTATTTEAVPSTPPVEQDPPPSAAEVVPPTSTAETTP